VCIVRGAEGAITVRTRRRLCEGCFDNKFEIRFRTQRPKADGQASKASRAGLSARDSCGLLRTRASAKGYVTKHVTKSILASPVG